MTATQIPISSLNGRRKKEDILSQPYRYRQHFIHQSFTQYTRRDHYFNNTTQPSTSFNSTQVIETTKERSSESTKPKRKKRNPSVSARNERELLRISGQAYMTSRGKKAEARQMTDGCSMSCRYNVSC